MRTLFWAAGLVAAALVSAGCAGGSIHVDSRGNVRGSARVDPGVEVERGDPDERAARRESTACERVCPRIVACQVSIFGQWNAVRGCRDNCAASVEDERDQALQDRLFGQVEQRCMELKCDGFSACLQEVVDGMTVEAPAKQRPKIVDNPAFRDEFTRLYCIVLASGGSDQLPDLDAPDAIDEAHQLAEIIQRFADNPEVVAELKEEAHSKCAGGN